MQTEEKQQEYVRQQFSDSGLMFLFCSSCCKLIAYSARADLLAIVESVHSRNCTAASPSVATD